VEIKKLFLTSSSFYEEWGPHR